MNSSEKAIAGVTLRSKKPTTVPFSAIADWVIWQFPQREKKGYRGAVRPPGEQYSWLPAVVLPETESVRVYGHLDEAYHTPETAVAFFSKKKA
jgi:hypothetical protein